MSTHMAGFQSFSSFFASFCSRKISHQQHKGLKASPVNEIRSLFVQSHKKSSQTFDGKFANGGLHFILGGGGGARSQHSE